MARQYPKPNWSTHSFNTSHLSQHPSPGKPGGMEALLSEAMMKSHKRRTGHRWPWLCLKRGSGGCEFCPCHLLKRAVELLKESPYPMAWPTSFRWTYRDSQGLRELSLESLFFPGALQSLSVLRVHAEKLCGR